MASLCLADAAVAATFVLNNDEVIEGEVIHATRNTLMIRRTIGGVHQLSRSDMDSIRVTTEDGDVISGSLVGWQGGVYEIEAENRLIQVQNRRIVGETAIKLPVLTITEAEANEASSDMVFRIDLSRPVQKSILIIYATFDRTATAGEDYEAERGTLKLAPGDSSAQVRIPLINDDVVEGNETLELFVATDKTHATVNVERTVGTILNDDD